MTIKTFWTIIIKFLGLWLVMNSLQVILQFISGLIFLKENTDTIEIIYSLFVLLLTIGLYAIILWLFVFKSNWIIEKLHLDKGFYEEKIDFKISSKTMLTISIIIFSSLLLAESIPNFCKQVFMFFQQKNIFRQSPSAGTMIYYFIEIIIGYVLIRNSKFLASFIDKKSKDKMDNSI